MMIKSYQLGYYLFLMKKEKKKRTIEEMFREYLDSYEGFISLDDFKREIEAKYPAK